MIVINGKPTITFSDDDIVFPPSEYTQTGKIVRAKDANGDEWSEPFYPIPLEYGSSSWGLIFILNNKPSFLYGGKLTGYPDDLYGLLSFASNPDGTNWEFPSVIYNLSTDESSSAGSYQIIKERLALAYVKTDLKYRRAENLEATIWSQTMAVDSPENEFIEFLGVRMIEVSGKPAIVYLWWDKNAEPDNLEIRYAIYY